MLTACVPTAPPATSPTVTIVRELIETGDGFVSGNKLAKQLGISRVAIWAHMEKLRALGFAVEAVRRRGYRLLKRPEQLDDIILQALLCHRGATPRLHFLTTTDSTNSEAERRLAAGEETPFAVLAVKQERGRGRLGRRWFSEDEGNLYVSFAFRPELRPAAMQHFTLWMGVNVCEALANACRIDIGVKWPNDILHHGRKLGGMLTEARIDADHTRDVIFGLGLNLNSQRQDWPRGIAPLATSVNEALGHTVDMNRVAAAVVSRVFKAYEAFVAGEYRSDFDRLWKRFDVLTGRKITVLFGDRHVTGTVDGIDASGALRLRDHNGKVYQCLAGDVTIEKTGL